MVHMMMVRAIARTLNLRVGGIFLAAKALDVERNRLLSLVLLVTYQKDSVRIDASDLLLSPVDSLEIATRLKKSTIIRCELTSETR